MTSFRILVTGHRGYIGTVMTPMLLRAGHDVVGLDSDIFRRCTFEPGGEMAVVPTLEKDIRDVEPTDLIGFDAVIHLAALSNDPLGDFRPEITAEINHDATVRLAGLARDAGVSRFIFSSSCSTYGAAGDDLIDETRAFNPLTPYGVSKVEAEKDVVQLARDDFSPTFMRSATAFGVSPRLRFDLVLNNLVAWAYTTGRIYMKSDGTPWRPIVHIEDISRAFLAALSAPREVVHAQAFNVGRTDSNYTIQEIAEIVAEIVPGCRIDYAEGAGPDRRCYRVRCDKIRDTLPHFQPEWDARRGAAELHAAYQAGSITVDDFEGPRYQRIGHIQKLITDGIIDERLRHLPSGAATGGRPSPRAATHPDHARGDGSAPDPARERETVFRERCAGATCRSCERRGLSPVLDLGLMPLADGLVAEDQLGSEDPRYPLELAFCPDCTLVQITETVPPDVLFAADYPYFSSFSDELLRHSRENARELTERHALGPDSLVVELASNDGYLLKNFREWGVPVLGIDPAPGPVAAARKIDVETLCEFFSLDVARRLRSEGRQADIIIANNVLAHVADTNGFVAGMAELVRETGTIVIEAPYVRDLIDHGQFDTIYHEHLCYFSATSVAALFRRHGLHLNHVRRIPIHGGSLRYFLQPTERVGTSVRALIEEERKLGLDGEAYYDGFAARVREIRQRMLELVTDLRGRGKRLAAYGAAAKGTIMLNYLGLDHRSIDFVVDRNVHKHRRYMPGARLLIHPPSQLLEARPDYVIILPWNFREEIVAQQADYLAAGGRFIIPIPEPEIL